MSRASQWIAIVVVAVLALLPFVPGAVDAYYFSFLFFVFLYAVMAQSWNLVAGYGGQISLGSHAFFGLGAYTTAILWSGNYLWGSLYDSHPNIYYFDPVTMLLGGLVAAIAAVVIGLPLLSKLHGDYFALGTLGFGEIVKVIFVNGGDFTGGAFGIVAPASSFGTLRPHYWVGLGLMVATALAIRMLMRSRYGLALIAVRDDEMAASANGIDTLKVKVAAFAGSAFIAGVAGSLYTFYIFHVGPDSVFDLDWMLLPLMMTVVGGTGTILGPILGALVMYAVFDLARIVVPDYHPVISGLTIILAMLFLPKGMMRLSRKARVAGA
ncbi:branched-chain amino acid ABC transporter permease [Mesorhizobium sp. M2D.F.Ca.ET.185.01.1.1]|uniref:branched-chain amino acid ABC transporter permease n=1 Tax=unclassified Mesorhizobium TaxID=325217 RepID=UPI000FCC26AC|nr:MULTISPECIES: branched-chain amino acid ABC transporter permease [unclassified Mesorhizobium]TGP75032.1 branched-chain amino acid ABC transporter permease [bacterium M00.F.Ca.ET.227.01.1.1]TGP85359.1 branched-chain amino acid ABC transporter permease [bacterium M00.F.Ca.ET.221.01.1.1]TGP89785.1 branched-chain amino acid ABC transporter permease [bacterium M00.F.Ca.ET.222.01.1.1]TGU05789.1 branched-chain amino acid ABC transporter permease [bacterium M00.F.Ca.ET.163.01.1.1]TGU25080.1 branche